MDIFKSHHNAYWRFVTFFVLFTFSPDKCLSSELQRCVMKPDAQPAKTVFPGPTPLLLLSLFFVLVLNSFAAATPQLAVQLLPPLAWRLCGLLVSAQCGSAAGGGRGR